MRCHCRFFTALLPVCAAALLSLAAHSAWAQSPAVTLTPDPNNTVNYANQNPFPYGYSLGYTFTTNTALTVTSLGYFTPTGSFAEDHAVGLYTESGTLLATATVNNSSDLIDNFAYTSITPYELAANSTYTIAAFSGRTDLYTFNPTSFSTIPEIQYEYSNSFYSTSLEMPYTRDYSTTGIFGPNFQAVSINAAVPETGTLAMVLPVLGIVGVAFVRRRKK